MRQTWIRRNILALSALAFFSVTPARADGTLGLDEVLTAVAKAPKLVVEIRAELDKDNLKAENVTCLGARHGNQWKYLGGGRAAPYRCDIGKRSIVIEADRLFRRAGQIAGRCRKGRSEAGKDISGEQLPLDLDTVKRELKRESA
jgi:hypothetical protein